MSNDLISREALKEAIKDSDIIHHVTNLWYKDILKEIDNAPTVPLPDFKEGYKQAIIDGKTNFQRQQGECKTCRYRDPEDKKCDCGGEERQGCLFPVSDDYYCNYYTRKAVQNE